MAPIRKGDGTPLDIPGVSEVRSGDGRVFFEADAIPDSAVFHWPFFEGSGSTLAEELDNQDGSISGATWVDNNWYEDYGLDFDGTDDYVETTTWGDFGSSVGGPIWISISFKLESDDHLIGVGSGQEGGGQTRLELQSGGGYGSDTDTLAFILRDDNGDDLSFNTSSTVTSGTRYHAVINKDADDGSDAEIWLTEENEPDVNQESITVQRDDFDGSEVYDFEENVAFGANNFRGDISGQADCEIGRILVGRGDTLSESEIQQLNDQEPWV